MLGSLVPRPVPDLISQHWRKIDFSPHLRDKSESGLGMRQEDVRVSGLSKSV